jgi:hypothetical protein
LRHHHYVNRINFSIAFEDLRINLLKAFSGKRMLEGVEAIKDEIIHTDIDKSLKKANFFILIPNFVRLGIFVSRGQNGIIK